MSDAALDVIGIGNALVDVLSQAEEEFLIKHELVKGSMTLIEADRAYLDSGGSFNALVVSLLSSDSFLLRQTPTQAGKKP